MKTGFLGQILHQIILFCDFIMNFYEFMNPHFSGEKGQTFDRPSFSNVKEWLLSLSLQLQRNEHSGRFYLDQF